MTISTAPSADTTTAVAVQVRNVGVAYGSITALDAVTLDIPEGASVAVIGPNGSGKSTLLKVMAGIERPTSGAIDTGGRAVGIVLQSTDVDPSVPISTRDAVALARFADLGLLGRFRASDRELVASALRRLDVEDLADRPIHQLSGGQRQRVFVAQGLAQNAPILLLDEPLTGLDVGSRSLIAEVLAEERAAGRTTVVTTHNFADAQRSDLVVLLATGCIAYGPPAEVLVEDHLRQAFGGRLVRVGETIVLDDPHHDHHH